MDHQPKIDLIDSQRKVLKKMTDFVFDSDDRVFILKGYAGMGKTTLMRFLIEELKEIPINERQRKVINRLLDGFEGKLTSSKWAKLVKCSSDTALRDIEDLMQKGLIVREGTGRGTYYELKR